MHELIRNEIFSAFEKNGHSTKLYHNKIPLKINDDWKLLLLSHFDVFWTKSYLCISMPEYLQLHSAHANHIINMIFIITDALHSSALL